MATGTTLIATTRHNAEQKVSSATRDVVLAEILNSFPKAPKFPIEIKGELTLYWPDIDPSSVAHTGHSDYDWDKFPVEYNITITRVQHLSEE